MENHSQTDQTDVQVSLQHDFSSGLSGTIFTLGHSVWPIKGQLWTGFSGGPVERVLTCGGSRATNRWKRTKSVQADLGRGEGGGARWRQASIGCCWGVGVATAGSSAWTMLLGEN